MKTLWIIANWKSHKTIAEALQWIDELAPVLQTKEQVHVVVCPDFTALEEVKKSIQVSNLPLWVGSQDLSPFPEGPHTGEESAQMIKGLVELAVLGHSERRRELGETDAMIKEKVDQAKKVGIVPLVCVQDSKTPIPEGVDLVAYEPIFAIGTGAPDTPENAQNVAATIKKTHQVAVLYGGSVDSANVLSFLNQDDIQGVLIGGASLDAKEFSKILKKVYEKA